MGNAISVHCVGIVWAVLQSACLLSQTNVSADNVNSNDCTTDAHFRYTNNQHQKVLMVLVLFCPSSYYYQKTMSHSSINFSFHNWLHLSMLKGLRDAIRHPNFVCIRLTIKFSINNFSTYIFLWTHFCCMAYWVLIAPLLPDEEYCIASAIQLMKLVAMFLVTDPTTIKQQLCLSLLVQISLCHWMRNGCVGASCPVTIIFIILLFIHSFIQYKV